MKKANTLNARQKAGLILWLKEKAEAKETYSELATMAEDALGCVVTTNNVKGWWTAVNGPRKVQKPAGPKLFADKLGDLGARVTEIEDSLPKRDAYHAALAREAISRVAELERAHGNLRDRVAALEVRTAALEQSHRELGSQVAAMCARMAETDQRVSGIVADLESRARRGRDAMGRVESLEARMAALNTRTITLEQCPSPGCPSLGSYITATRKG